MHHDTKTVAICNQKGGVGKTTITVNLAATTAELFPPTLPPDWQNADPPLPPAELREKYEAQVLAVSTDPQSSLLNWLTKGDKAAAELGQPFPLDFAQQHTKPEVLGRLKKLKKYRRIYVDTPGWLESDDPDAPRPLEEKILTATLQNVDLVVVPVLPEPLAYEPTKKTIKEVILPLGVPFVVVLSAWDPRDGEGDLNDTRRWVERNGWPLATTVVRRYKLHTASPAIGRLCTGYARNRVALEARNDFHRLSNELALIGGN